MADYCSEFQRLRLLENAIINYGDGHTRLENRAATLAEMLREHDPHTAASMNDIACYLLSWMVMAVATIWIVLIIPGCRMTFSALLNTIKNWPWAFWVIAMGIMSNTLFISRYLMA